MRNERKQRAMKRKWWACFMLSVTAFVQALKCGQLQYSRETFWFVGSRKPSNSEAGRSGHRLYIALGSNACLQLPCHRVRIVYASSKPLEILLELCHLLLPPSAPPLGAFALKLPSNPGLAFGFPFPFFVPDFPPFFPFSSFRFCRLASRFFCFIS